MFANELSYIVYALKLHNSARLQGYITHNSFGAAVAFAKEQLMLARLSQAYIHEVSFVHGGTFQIVGEPILFCLSPEELMERALMQSTDAT